jgi:hypothetical protein
VADIKGNVMGPGFMKHTPANPVKAATGINRSAKAFGAPAFAARSSGMAAAKDLAAASALSKHLPKSDTKTAASNAPGPKGV